MKKQPWNYAAWYDRSLAYILNKHLSRDIPWPQPTHKWPRENIEILERYAAWRIAGGASVATTQTIYAPTAGQVLGLACRPYHEFDLSDWLNTSKETAFSRAYAFLLARNLSEDRTKICRNALENFRRFLRQKRGLPEIVTRKPYPIEKHTAGLPAWLVQELRNYQLIQQRNWRPARLEDNITWFWSGHLRVWRFLVEQCTVQELTNLRRQHFFDYMDFRLELGRAVSGVNKDIRVLCGFLGFLQEQGYAVPQMLLKVPSLAQPARLPRFLTDHQVGPLRADFEQRVEVAHLGPDRRDALLDRAAFYLLWQSGLRIGEVEEMQVGDLDLPGRRLTVRRTKNLQDRTVYLSEHVARSLEAYLQVRGPALTDHVFIFRNRAIKKDLLRDRIKAAGKRVGVKVTPHQLRHTCATQLLNAGCKVTSIQRFLGHKRLNSTMIYAYAHDATVADDYFEAMETVERQQDVKWYRK